MNNDKDLHAQACEKLLADTSEAFQRKRIDDARKVSEVLGLYAGWSHHAMTHFWTGLWVTLFPGKTCARAIRKAAAIAHAAHSFADKSMDLINAETPCQCPACKMRRGEIDA